MSGVFTVPDKPPWTKIQWYQSSSVPRIQSNDDIFLVKGEWQEDSNQYIESLKETIQPYDKTEVWDLAKRITNPYELVSTFSSRLPLPKSTCCIRPLSRSFFKMIEIIKHLDFFTRHMKVKKLRSLHICEGPGGFIEAFLNRAENARVKVHNVYGMTLKSTNSIIPGWRRAQQFLQRNPVVQLVYGTGTGDIYEEENQTILANTCSLGVQFITADGGFDFSEDFHAQEKSVLRLLVNSALIILRCLAEDGDCVLKLFDIQSQATRDFVYVLSTCFSSWTLYKPITSRPCNSEWYFLGKSAYRTRTVQINVLTEMRNILSTEDSSIQRVVKVNPIQDLLITLQKDRLSVQETALKEVLDFCKQLEREPIDYNAKWESHRKETIHWCHSFGMPTNHRVTNL